MSPRLVGPPDAADAVAAAVRRGWADAVLTELGDAEPEGRDPVIRHEIRALPVTDDGVGADEPGTAFTCRVPLHPGVSHARHVRAIGLDVWQGWADAWRAVEPDLGPGGTLLRGAVDDPHAPDALVVTDLDAAARLVSRHGTVALPVDVVRARRVAAGLTARGAALSARTLRAAVALDDVDVDVLASALTWLTAHPDVTGLTERQLTVPGMHTKWLRSHGTLLADLLGRDVRAHVRPRPPVAHLTYVDPVYLGTGGRRHDAWTAGDTHDLAYPPRTVVVVENRDCRLWFPDLPGAVVAEGGGAAATALLAHAPWVRAAAHVVYWGDLDADGFAILDRFRTALARPSDTGPARPVRSVLMDAATLHTYGHLGVAHDRHGRPLRRVAVHLASLTDLERAAYDEVTTSGDVPVRRIEQERLPFDVACASVMAATGGR